MAQENYCVRFIRSEAINTAHSTKEEAHTKTLFNTNQIMSKIVCEL